MTIANILRSELKKRKDRNKLYSLRGFAKSLEISPTYLSELINEKKTASHNTALKILSSLNTSPKIMQKILMELSANIEGRRKVNKQEVKPRKMISEEEFSEMATWEHFAVLNLAKVDLNKFSPTWISQKLEISKNSAKEILGRLSNKGLIFNNNGKIERCQNYLRTTTNIPSRFIRDYHRSAINKSIDSIEKVPVSERYYTTNTFALNSSDYERLSKMIAAFCSKVGAIAEKGTNKDRVYQLAIQLTPLDRKD